MIEITFNPKEMELSIGGHASYGEKGKDIVCAAVSILFYTLNEALCDCREMLTDFNTSAEEGESTIKCTPKPEYAANIETVYMTVLTGMQLMANEYPDHVKFSVKG